MTNHGPQSDLEIYTRVATECTCGNLRKTARVITQLYDEFLRPSGLLGTQFRLLGAIAANGPIAMTPLAEHMAMDRTTLTRNLKPLERDGLVEMVTGKDRRTHLYRITDKGRAAVTKAIPMWEEAQAWIVAQLGEKRWRTMLGDWSELVSLVHER